MEKVTYLLLPLILWASFSFAQVKFTAAASKTNVAVDEPFEVVFTLDNNYKYFTPPDFSAFVMVSGPDLSSNTSEINAVIIYTRTYSYTLVAKKEGTFNIGAATIRVNTEKFFSNVLKIKVKGWLPAGQTQVSKD